MKKYSEFLERNNNSKERIVIPNPSEDLYSLDETKSIRMNINLTKSKERLAKSKELKEFETDGIETQNFNLSVEIETRTKDEVIVSQEVKRFFVTFNDIKKVRHELCSGIITKEFFRTDTPLGNYVEGSVLTPDWIIETENAIHLFEFFTTSSIDPKYLSKKYKEKVSYYLTELNSSLNQWKNPEKVFFINVIGFSSDSYISPVQLDLDETTLISKLFPLAEVVKTRAGALGWFNEFEKDKLNRIERLWTDWKKININLNESSEDKLEITEELIRKWSEELRFIENDPDLIRAKYLECIKEGIVNSKERMNVKKYEEYFETFNGNINNEKISGEIKKKRESLKKNVLSLPIFIPSNLMANENENAYPFYQSIDKGLNLMSSFMRKLMESYFDHMRDFKFRSEEDSYEKAMNPMAERPKDLHERRNFRRCNVIMSEQEGVYLAQRGVQGKTYKNYYEVIEHYKESKRHFTLDVNTKDIDEYFNEFENLMSDSNMNFDELSKNHSELIKMAMLNETIDFPMSERIIDSLNKTWVGNSLAIFSKVLEEINLSFSHTMRRNEFELKKIRGLDLYVVTKSTKVSSHIFFSVIIRKKNFKKKFPLTSDWIEIGEEWLCSEFFSLNRHRLSHLVMTAEKFVAITSANIEIFHDDFGKNPTFLDSKVKRHAAFQILCFLESKQQTSSNIQQLRYFYMECCKNNDFWPVDPCKILSKLDISPKSRLLVWIYKKWLKLAKYYQGKRSPVKFKFDYNVENLGELDPEIEDIITNKSKDIVENLFSLIEDKEGNSIVLGEFRQALHIFYTCNIHNKEDRDKNQNCFKLFAKICEEELSLYSSDFNYMGHEQIEENRKLKSHEFDLRAVMIGCMLTRNKLEEKYGGYFIGELKNQFGLEMSRKTTDEFATFKSSGKIDKGGYKTKIETKGINKGNVVIKNQKQTQKAIVTMTELLNEGLIKENPYDSLSLLFDKLDETGAIVQLDEKDQIGGTREIGILEAHTRLIIHWLETLSRVIGRHIPQEMLTKNIKIKVAETHYLKTKVLTGEKDVCIVSNDSDDATRWAQSFVMNMFGCMMFVLLPNDLFRIVIKILNHWSRKRILLPAKVINLFMKHKDIRMPEETDMKYINLMKDQYFGKSNINNLVNKGEPYLKNRSNMVQGIMHFTSSLYACALTNFNVACSNYLDECLFNLKKGAFPVDHVFFQTNLNSSDDASRHWTFIIKFFDETKHGSLLPIIKSFFTVITSQKRMTYKRFGVAISDPKTVSDNRSPLSEFNSVFRVGNGLIVPLIKYIFQTVDMKSTSDLGDSQRINSNMTKQIVESGGSTLLASICQKCQMRIHYCRFGMNTSNLFNRYKIIIMNKPSIACGFFVLEPEQICGIFGINFSEWLMIKSNSDFNRSLKWFYENRLFEMNDLGKPTVKIEIKFGNAYLKKLNFENIGLSPELLEEVKLNINELYNVNPSERVIKYRIISKALKVPVDSFGVSTTSKMLASSVYILSKPCITVLLKNENYIDVIPKKGEIFIYEQDDEETKMKKRPMVINQLMLDQANKTSLLRLMQDINIKNELSEKEIQFLFPEFSSYEVALRKLKDMSQIGVYKELKLQIAFRFIEVKTPKVYKSNVLPIDVFRNYWFGISTEGTLTAKRNLFNELLSIYPFLNVNYLKVVDDENSPFFKDDIGLYNFISSLRSKEFRHTILGPLPTGLGTEKTIERIISLCYLHGSSYSIGALTSEDNLKQKKNDLHLSLTYLNEIPFSFKEKSQLAIEILSDTRFNLILNTNDKIGFYLKNNKTTKSIALLQYYFRSPFSSRDDILIREMKDAKEGVIMNWEIVQTKSKGNWIGYGRAKVFIDGDPFKIHVFDNQVQAIETLNYRRLARNWKTIINLFVEMQINTTGDLNYSTRSRIPNLERIGQFKKDFGLKAFKLIEGKRDWTMANIYQNEDIMKEKVGSDNFTLSLTEYSIQLVWSDENKRNFGGSALAISLKDKKLDYNQILPDFIYMKLMNNLPGSNTITPLYSDFLRNKPIAPDIFWVSISSIYNELFDLNNKMSKIAYGPEGQNKIKEILDESQWKKILENYSLRETDKKILSSLIFRQKTFILLRRIFKARCPNIFSNKFEKSTLIEIVKEDNFDPFSFAMSFIEKKNNEVIKMVVDLKEGAVESLKDINAFALRVEEIILDDFKEEEFFQDYSVVNEDSKIDPLKYTKLTDLVELQFIELFGSVEKLCLHINGESRLSFTSERHINYANAWNTIFVKRGSEISFGFLPDLTTKKQVLDKLSKKRSMREVLNIQKMLSKMSDENPALLSITNMLWKEYSK